MQCRPMGAVVLNRRKPYDREQDVRNAERPDQRAEATAGARPPRQGSAPASPAPETWKEAAFPNLSGENLAQAAPVKDAPRIDPRAGQLPSAGQLVDTAKLDRCLLFPPPRSPGGRPAGGLRDLGTSRVVLRQHVQRGACAGDQPGDLPLSPAGAHLRAAVHRLRYPCAVPARLRERARGAGGERRRCHDLEGRRIHADAGDLAGDPRPQPRAHRRGWPTASSSRRRTIRPRMAASSTTPRTAVRRKPASRAGSRSRPMRCWPTG